jgi:hypothetical protein
VVQRAVGREVVGLFFPLLQLGISGAGQGFFGGRTGQKSRPETRPREKRFFLVAAPALSTIHMSELHTCHVPTIFDGLLISGREVCIYRVALLGLETSMSGILEIDKSRVCGIASRDLAFLAPLPRSPRRATANSTSRSSDSFTEVKCTWARWPSRIDHCRDIGIDILPILLACCPHCMQARTTTIGQASTDMRD